MTDSITFSQGGGYMASGPQAVDLLRISMLKSAIKMAKGGMMITRGMTLTKCLKMATEYTGNKYKRTEADKAMADLTDLTVERVADGLVEVNAA